MNFERFISKLYDQLEKGKGTDFVSSFQDHSLSLRPSILYYNSILFEKCIRIFEWTGLPFDQKALEAPLMATGYAGFLFDEEYAGYVALPGGLTGVTPFGDLIRSEFVYAAPKCEGGTRILYPYSKYGDCVLVENTSMRNSILPLIQRYAVLLAHSDVSIRDALINIRYNDVIPAADDSEAESVKKWHDKVINGEFSPIPDSSFLQRAPIIPLNITGKGQIALDTIQAKEELLRAFFQEIGLRMVKDKRSNMIEDEVSASDMLLMFNISDMLKQREAAAGYINEIFPDLNISVRLSPEFNMLKADPENENSEPLIDEYDGDN